MTNRPKMCLRSEVLAPVRVQISVLSGEAYGWMTWDCAIVAYGAVALSPSSSLIPMPSPAERGFTMYLVAQKHNTISHMCQSVDFPSPIDNECLNLDHQQPMVCVFPVACFWSLRVGSEPQRVNASYCAGTTQQSKLNDSSATGGSSIPVGLSACVSTAFRVRQKESLFHSVWRSPGSRPMR